MFDNTTMKQKNVYQIQNTIKYFLNLKYSIMLQKYVYVVKLNDVVDLSVGSCQSLHAWGKPQST